MNLFEHKNIYSDLILLSATYFTPVISFNEYALNTVLSQLFMIDVHVQSSTQQQGETFSVSCTFYENLIKTGLSFSRGKVHNTASQLFSLCTFEHKYTYKTHVQASTVE